MLKNRTEEMKISNHIFTSSLSQIYTTVLFLLLSRKLAPSKPDPAKFLKVIVLWLFINKHTKKKKKKG